MERASSPEGRAYIAGTRLAVSSGAALLVIWGLESVQFTNFHSCDNPLGDGPDGEGLSCVAIECSANSGQRSRVVWPVVNPLEKFCVGWS